MLIRTCRVRLIVDNETEKKLFELGDIFAKCWNEVNYLRRQQFFNEVGVDFKTTIHLKGKQGRLEIHYDAVTKRWYAYIPFKVEKKIVRNDWRKVPLAPSGNKEVGIDLGINNLFAVFVEDGTTFPISGRPLKAEAFYWRKKIAEAQSKGIWTELGSTTPFRGADGSIMLDQI